MVFKLNSYIKRVFFLCGYFFSVFMLLVSCQSVPAPVEEWTIARAAMNAAKSVQAARYSPGYWHQAEDAYRKARVLMKDNSYEEARRQFEIARKAAEKAENSARIKRQENGEIL
ncbi:MAG: DUF4398 domain-containing protein [Bdellovibrionales bacterium]|nr:DUF4398 domain-containing protein [Bdellovibrionales bacterium]